MRYDAILLLGVELTARDEPTQELRARVLAAARAYRQGLAPKIVACGGQLPGHATTEAAVMARLLGEAGVPGQAVLAEAQSQNTAENMRFAAALLGGARGRRVLVVTSDYHLRRAVMTARRALSGAGARRPAAAWRGVAPAAQQGALLHGRSARRLAGRGARPPRVGLRAVRLGLSASQSLIRARAREMKRALDRPLRLYYNEPNRPSNRLAAAWP